MASSHLILLAAASILVLQQTSAVTFCNTVNIPAVKKCYQTYMASFNVKMTDTIPEYSVFRDARSALFQKNGLYEQTLNTQFVTTLLNCLDSNFECMGRETYLALGASDAVEIMNYWTDLLINQYESTTEGNKLKTDNFYCFENCRKDHAAEIKACRDNMRISFNKGMQLCEALQTNADCQAAIQNKCCGYNASVLACNIEITGARGPYQTCSEMGKVYCPVARDD